VTEKEPMLSVDQRDGPEHDDDQRSRGEAAQESDHESQTAEELSDGDGITERPHAIRGRLDHGRQTRPTESAEELLRAMGGKDDADDQAHGEQGDVHGLTVLQLIGRSIHAFVPCQESALHKRYRRKLDTLHGCRYLPGSCWASRLYLSSNAKAMPARLTLARRLVKQGPVVTCGCDRSRRS